MNASVTPARNASDRWQDILPATSRRTFLAAAGLSGLTALLAACAAEPTTGTAPAATGAIKRGGTLRVGASAPSTAVNPVTMYDPTSIGIVQLVADYLIWLDKDFKLVPRLAVKWSSDPAAKVWTFVLRDGVRFSDGTPLDAETVKASFDRLLDPANKSAALSAFSTVLGQGGVTVADPRTVVFTLKRAFSDFPYLVSAGNYNTVVLKKDYSGDFTKAAVGTGPFTLASYNASTGASFKRNPSYWDSGKPYLDGVEVHFYADDQAGLVALQSGDIDSQLTSRAALVKPLAGKGGLAVDEVHSTNVTVLSLRTDRAPFDRKEVRQAIAFALDRPALLTSAGGGTGDLGNDHLFAPAFPSAPKDIPQRAKDGAKVAELLKAAGVDQLTFPLTFEPASQDYALAIQNQLKQVGITVQLDQRTSKEFYGGDQAKDTPWLFSTANLVGWAGRPTVGQLITPMVKSGATWNGSKYANPVLDQAAEAYDAATTSDQRAAQAEIIAKTLNEDVPIIIAYWSGAVRAYNGQRFTGVQAHPSQFVDFTTVSQI